MRMINYSTLLFLICLLFPVIAQAQGPMGNAPSPVFATEVQKKFFVDEVEALGTLRANESVDLNATVTELVTLVNFEDGQRVKKGDLLVEMDAAEELAELAEEKSTLEEARRQAKRLEPLVKSGAASESNLDERRREVETTKARVDAIQSRIDLRRTVAPFDGVLGLRNISVGALAQPGRLITTIDDDSIMKLDFSVPSVFLETLKPGVKIEAVTKAYPADKFTGEISSIDSRVDPVTRAVKARALIDNADLRLKPGMLMRVILQKNPRQTLVVPEEALIVDGNENYVMRIIEADGNLRVERAVVTLGTRQFGNVEILEGLNGGDRIVNHGALKLRPGAAVTIKAMENEDKPLKELLNESKQAE